MKRYFLISLLASVVVLAIPDNSWSRVHVNQNSYSAAIPRNVLVTANDWMYANAVPYTRIRPTYTNLGKGLWEIRWTWQIASGNIYDATLVIKNNGQLLNDPIIYELSSWPY